MPNWINTAEFSITTLLRRFTTNVVMVGLLVTTAIALTQFDAAEPRPSSAPEFGDPLGSGLIVRSDVIRVWVPENLADPAAHEYLAQSHQDLRKVLERRGQETLWYAITVRTQLSNHQAEESSFIRYPYRNPEYLPEFIDVLNVVNESPICPRSDNYAEARVHMMPADMSERDWREAMQASSTEHGWLAAGD